MDAPLEDELASLFLFFFEDLPLTALADLFELIAHTPDN
jgi:hypothetical protein